MCLTKILHLCVIKSNCFNSFVSIHYYKDTKIIYCASCSLVLDMTGTLVIIFFFESSNIRFFLFFIVSTEEARKGIEDLRVTLGIAAHPDPSVVLKACCKVCASFLPFQ